MAKVYKTASGARDPSGRDLVFEQWFKDNIARVEGGRLEQRSIYKAYRQFQRGDRALGVQGVERMLNTLGVKRKVLQGKPYRLGVGFKADVATPAVALAQANARPGALVTDGLRDAARLSSSRVTFEGEGWRGVIVGEDGPAMRSLAVVSEVYAERRRQVAEEGFDAAHDDASDPGAHERAAACYAYAAAQPEHLTPFVETASKLPRTGRLGWFVRDMLVTMWPWAAHWWKPQTDRADWKRRCLVKACALGLAAIERIDREKARADLEAAQRSQMTGV